MIYKFWDKSIFCYCKNCVAVYVPRHLNENEHRTMGLVEQVERCEECCIVCPRCGNLIEWVKGARKIQFKGTLSKSGELRLDDNPIGDDILEIYCNECEGRLETEKDVKELV